MKILLIDNYDSFTFNLYHYLSSLSAKVDVVRNDQITEKEILKNIPIDPKKKEDRLNKIKERMKRMKSKK